MPMKSLESHEFNSGFTEKNTLTERWNNLVPRAFPIEFGRGGKRPWHRLVT